MTTPEKSNGKLVDFWEDHETLMTSEDFLELMNTIKLFKQAELILAEAQKYEGEISRTKAIQRLQPLIEKLRTLTGNLNTGEIQMLEDIKDCDINPSERMDWNFFINIEPNANIRVHRVLKSDPKTPTREIIRIIRIGDPKWFGLMDKIMLRTAYDMIKKESAAKVSGDAITRKSAMRIVSNPDTIQKED